MSFLSRVLDNLDTALESFGRAVHVEGDPDAAADVVGAEEDEGDYDDERYVRVVRVP